MFFFSAKRTQREVIVYKIKWEWWWQGDKYKINYDEYLALGACAWWYYDDDDDDDYDDNYDDDDDDSLELQIWHLERLGG